MRSRSLCPSTLLRSPPTPAPSSEPLTRRGVMWLGQTCNLRCQFCYFLDRIEDDEPSRARLHDARQGEGDLPDAGRLLRQQLGRHPGRRADALAAHLRPRRLLRRDRPVADAHHERARPSPAARVVARYRDAGIRDFLVSVQGLGTVYDELVRQARRTRAADAARCATFRRKGFRSGSTRCSRSLCFRSSSTSRELAVRTGAEVVNFLGFNPFNDQETGQAQRRRTCRATRSCGAPLDGALDLLAAAGVEANVRYLPFCVVARAPPKLGLRLPADPVRPARERLRELVVDRPARAADARHAAQRRRSASDRGFALGPLRAPLRRLACGSAGSRRGDCTSVKQRLERLGPTAAGGSLARRALSGRRAHARPRVHGLPARGRRAATAICGPCATASTATTRTSSARRKPVRSTPAGRSRIRSSSRGARRRRSIQTTARGCSADRSFGRAPPDLPRHRRG